MNKEENEKEFENGEFDIEVGNPEWISEYIVKGHYVFEIIVKKKTDNNVYKVYTTVKRRYN